MMVSGVISARLYWMVVVVQPRVTLPLLLWSSPATLAPPWKRIIVSPLPSSNLLMAMKRSSLTAASGKELATPMPKTGDSMICLALSSPMVLGNLAVNSATLGISVFH